jgi:hypothetical protein
VSSGNFTGMFLELLLGRVTLPLPRQSVSSSLRSCLAAAGTAQALGRVGAASSTVGTLRERSFLVGMTSSDQLSAVWAIQ